MTDKQDTVMGISFVIPLYNKEKTIENCLAKIFCQNNQSFEVIVVDDGSTDDSVKNLQAYSDRIHLITQENQGPSVARNNGARQASFDYLSFIDADDEITADFVESHLQTRRDDIGVELSINSFKVYEHGVLEREEILSQRYPFPQNQAVLVIDELVHHFTSNVHSSGFCVNKDVFFRTGGFDEKLRCWEISDMMTRLSLAANKIALVDKVLSLVFADDNSLFKAGREDLEYKKQYCNKIFSVIEQIPDHSKSRYYREVSNLCYDYWSQRQFRNLAGLYRQAMGYPSAGQYFTLPFKLKLISSLLSRVIPAN